MVLTASTMLPLGTAAPAFSLPATDGKTYTLDDFADNDVLVVAFMCNHCPYVKHIAPDLARLAGGWQDGGVGFVGINSNDAENYPDDSFDAMKAEVQERGYTFPYLFDDDQAVAKAYRAACTPDFFVFDKARKLTYRGQMDGSRPDSGIPVTGTDLDAAIQAARSGGGPLAEQNPSMGCNIKWAPGNEPDYFGAQ